MPGQVIGKFIINLSWLCDLLGKEVVGKMEFLYTEWEKKYYLFKWKTWSQDPGQSREDLGFQIVYFRLRSKVPALSSSEESAITGHPYSS